MYVLENANVRRGAALLVLVTVAGLLFVWEFSQLPAGESGLGHDWQAIWNNTHGLQADYARGKLFNPPWVLPLVWPFSGFGFQTSWGLAALANTAVLTLSVPRDSGRGRWLAGILLLVSSYPAMRHLLNGNIEGMLIGGILVAMWAYRSEHVPGMTVGVLLISSKPQLGWLFLAVLGLMMWKAWPRRKLWATAGWTLAYTLPFFIWKGPTWLDALVNDYDVPEINASLLATFDRLGMPTTISYVVWGVAFVVVVLVALRFRAPITRLKAGWLTAAAILLSPYATANSSLTPLALGVIPLVQHQPAWGLTMIALYNFPYIGLFNPQLRAALETPIYTAAVLTTLALLTVIIRNESADSEGKE